MIDYRHWPTHKLKALLKEMQINGASKSMTDLQFMRQIENILLERQR